MGLIGFAPFMGNQIAVDLGSANTRIHLKGEGVVLDEPSLVTWHKWDKKVVAVGNESLALLGRTPQHIDTIHPLKGGVVADYAMAKAMIAHFFKKMQKGFQLFKPQVLISTPSDISQVSKKAIREAVAEVGGGAIHLIAEPIAAALGAGLNIMKNHAHMLINIGSGTAEITVLFHGTIQYSEILRPAGDEISEAIGRHIFYDYNCQIGEVTVESCKAEIASAWDTPDLPVLSPVMVKDLESRSPRQIDIEAKPLRQALQEPLTELTRGIRMALDSLPEKVLVDIRQDGVLLCGGGSLLHGLDRLISSECDILCQRSQQPLLDTIHGCGLALEDLKQYKSLLLP